jgi:hypothetical protein
VFATYLVLTGVYTWPLLRHLGSRVPSNRYFLDFPKRLAIELSLDGETGTRVWEGPTAAQAFLALVRGPTYGAMRFPFSPRHGRFVRLLQLDRYQSAWRVSEIQVHGASPD